MKSSVKVKNVYDLRNDVIRTNAVDEFNKFLEKYNDFIKLINDSDIKEYFYIDVKVDGNYLYDGNTANHDFYRYKKLLTSYIEDIFYGFNSFSYQGNLKWLVEREISKINKIDTDAIISNIFNEYYKICKDEDLRVLKYYTLKDNQLTYKNSNIVNLKIEKVIKKINAFFTVLEKSLLTDDEVEKLESDLIDLENNNKRFDIKARDIRIKAFKNGKLTVILDNDKDIKKLKTLMESVDK